MRRGLRSYGADRSISLADAYDFYLPSLESPSNWKWDYEFIVAMAASRSVLRYKGLFSIDPKSESPDGSAPRTEWKAGLQSF